MTKGNPTRAVKPTGTEQPEGKRRVFTPGAITAMLDNGGLRYIRFHGLELLRGIAYSGTRRGIRR